METTIDASKLDQLEKTLQNMKEQNPNDPRYAEVERGLNELKLEVNPTHAAVSDIDALLKAIVCADNRGATALHMVTDPKMVKLLVDSGANLEALYDGLTPFLYKVSHSSHWDVAQALIDEGANVHAVDQKGNNAFHLIWDPSLIGKLAKLNIDINAKNARGQTPIQRHEHCLRIFKAFIVAGATYTPPEEEEELDKDEEEESAEEEEEESYEDEETKAVEKAYAAGNLAILASLYQTELMEQLWNENKANINSVDSDGQNVMFYLHYQNEIKEWMKRGADVNHRDNGGRTALDVAMNRARGGTAFNLVWCGAKVDDPKKFAEFAVCNSCSWSDVLDLVGDLHTRKRARTE